MTAWTDRYLAVPFKDGGRGWRGADCWGLYALVLATERGCAVPAIQESYGDDAGAVVRRVEAEMASAAWRCIVEGDGHAVKARAERFDAIVMSGHIRLPGGAVVRGDVHVGVAIGGGRVLHTEPQTGPHILAIDDPRIAKRVKGAYRPAILAEAA